MKSFSNFIKIWKSLVQKDMFEITIIGYACYANSHIQKQKKMSVLSCLGPSHDHDDGGGDLEVFFKNQLIFSSPSPSQHLISDDPVLPLKCNI